MTYTLAANVENLVLTGATAINGTGNDLANTLTGNAGNNTLDGKAGNDTLIGGLGNDTYVVDSADDEVEEDGVGTDLIRSSVTYELPDEVENLTLTGTLPMDGTGNALDNTLTGNGAANVLDGGAGLDTLSGGLGNDTYLVDSTGDVVVGPLSGGTDTVHSGASHTLSANVENLVLTGIGSSSGSGNGLNNTPARCGTAYDV